MQDMVIEHMHCMQIFCRLLSYQMPVHVIVRLFAMAARKIQNSTFANTMNLQGMIQVTQSHADNS